ncbi:uncharacterized protein [Coffea arabica]|uniref:KIB1-4 beta-propeller domain-containing protein n=1 Tax=Coffea arabica TaxID=13443 RepID=A0A6P6SAR9_COFAR|nr:uncharacterized protein LOC113689253 [Coffea arabica]
MEKTSNWGSLTDLLLDSILKKLVSLIDYVRFSAACKHRSAVAADPNMEKLHIETSANNQLPLLMIPTIKGSRKSRTLYNLSHGKANYDVELSVPLHRRCCGSSHGWLAFAMDDLSITLFNPFTEKVVLLANPITNPEYEVAVIYGDMHQLVFIKAGYEKSWSFIELDYWKITIEDFVGSKEFVVSDVIYHKGIIRCVNYHNRISNDTQARLLPRKQRAKSFGPGVLDDRVRADLLEVKTNLVESSGGKLLILR